MLKCENLSKSYNGTKVLNELSLEINKGEIVAFLGLSGVGKTTLLKCFNLLVTPDSGKIWLDSQLYFEDKKIYFEESEIREKIGIVFQDYNLFPALKVRDNLSLGLIKVKGIDRNQANSLVEDISLKLSITDLLDRYPETLSGGQAQRVALGRAILLEPEVLLLDEFTTSLDPNLSSQAISLIKGIQNSFLKKNTTVLIVTHSVQLAIETADRILFLYEGKIVENHKSGEFINNASHPIVQDFLKIG